MEVNYYTRSDRLLTVVEMSSDPVAMVTVKYWVTFCSLVSCGRITVLNNVFLPKCQHFKNILKIQTIHTGRRMLKIYLLWLDCLWHLQGWPHTNWLSFLTPVVRNLLWRVFRPGKQRLTCQCERKWHLLCREEKAPSWWKAWDGTISPKVIPGFYFFKEEGRKEVDLAR